tara:strand:+ start:2070 stop:2939 length:870 start_codon:yes stop_codon:yes gene_type:complete
MTWRENFILGGTGTLGEALIKKLGDKNCVVFSRDELKQANLKKKYPEIGTMLGDIRDYSSIENALKVCQPSRIFHVAALKHVDLLEENPEEAFKTNVLGTINAYKAAISLDNSCSFYFSSTDKAVLPINAYGMSKALAEKYLLSMSSKYDYLPYTLVFRWGNIVGSRGSVIPHFAKSLVEKQIAYVTDTSMTRFWLRIEDALDFMLSDLGEGKVHIPEMKSASVINLVAAIAEVLDIKEYAIETIGIRPGEKIHECVYSDHNNCIRSDTAPKWTHQELMDLVKPILEDL